MMLGLSEPHKKLMFKIPLYGFQDNVGYPVDKIRYSRLTITGGDVNDGWSPEERTFKVSGTNGV